MTQSSAQSEAAGSHPRLVEPQDEIPEQDYPWSAEDLGLTWRWNPEVRAFESDRIIRKGDMLIVCWGPTI